MADHGTIAAALDPTLSSREWWDKRQAAITEVATAEARRWFAEHGHDSIPDLEFDTPCCSVCGEHTDVDDDVFWCDICGLRWEMSGRHGEAEPDHPMRGASANQTSRCGECGGMLVDHRCSDCGTNHNGPEDRIYRCVVCDRETIITRGNADPPLPWPDPDGWVCHRSECAAIGAATDPAESESYGSPREQS